MRKRGLAALMTVVAALAVTTSSSGTFTGTNGLLVFQKRVAGLNPNDVQLFTIRPDGTGETQITHFRNTAATNAEWSPDGTSIVFTRVRQPNSSLARFTLYIANADGTGLRPLNRAGDLASDPNWTADGRRVVFLEARSEAIATINADGTGLRERVVSGRGGTAVCALRDGQHVAFLRSKTPREDDPRAIFVATLGGRRVRRITPWGSYADKIDCSPDGTRIVYSSPGFSEGRSNVFTIRTDGSDRVQLTHEKHGFTSDVAESWSPDGKEIAFISNRRNGSLTGPFELYTMRSVDGGDVTRLTTGDTHLASWGGRLH
jgi:Tol biopolymer transport system component